MQASSSRFNANYRGREAEHSNRLPAAASRSCSPNAKCQFCEFIEASKWESASDEPSTPQSISACPPDLNDTTTFAHCRASFEGMKVPQASVCVDPGCSDIVCEECSEKACEECSDHEDNCEDCVSGCRASDCADWIADCSTQNDNHIDEPYFELCGNQVAQIFSLDGRLPHLTAENLPIAYSGIAFCADAPLLAGHVGPQNSFGPYDQLELSSTPVHFPTQFHGLEGSMSAQLDYSMTNGTASTFSADWPSSLVVETAVPGEGTAPDIDSSLEPFENKIPARIADSSSSQHMPNLKMSAQFIRTKPVAIAPAHNFLSQECDVTQRRPSPNGASRAWTQCQWLEPNGQPCGKVSESGNEMHEHLKTAHNVNREVFCRWLGCRVGVLGPTPHKYASSVERHTWGHSGYRPYKCAICSEGFAAANVRDEHFANFHLQRKMFSCDICSHQCTSARNLKRHVDDTHKSERFQCEFCNRNGKIRLFPRGSNLARHFRKCKYVLALFPDAVGTASRKIDDDWFPPGYRGGHQGMEKAKIIPPNYLQVPTRL
jgi:hypothetical protein